MKKIAIGILGYNEELGVSQLLDSLKKQILLQKNYEITVTVVSNGSTDNMAAVSRQKIADFVELGVKSQVVELPIADKCAAWNYFVHQAEKEADYYILLDADVTIVNSDGLTELITRLEQNPESRLCAGKVIDRKGNLVAHRLDGKCYAARGSILRNIAIPKGIVMDDTYVLVTAVTNWYETDFETGDRKGYLQQCSTVTVCSGSTPRDRNFSYWLACRKRTITGGYVQGQVDYCMRNIFGGGNHAKLVSMNLFQTNPDWFTQYLAKKFEPPKFDPSFVMRSLFSLKDVVQFVVYCYCYVLSLKGIRDQEFGSLAWRLKSRYW
ncbi:MAG TPA: glycosyltransferase family A protein [Trichocoleus sp.]|jgi:glycosyltransferase involved in cell wall biosynthesis